MNGAFGSSRVRLSYHQGASSLEESWDRSFLAEVGALRERHKKGGEGQTISQGSNVPLLLKLPTQ